jgi:hypothetical protein
MTVPTLVFRSGEITVGCFSLTQRQARSLNSFLFPAYKCSNWKVSMTNCKTNLPPNTWTRAPGQERQFKVSFHFLNLLTSLCIHFRQHGSHLFHRVHSGANRAESAETRARHQANQLLQKWRPNHHRTNSDRLHN